MASFEDALASLRPGAPFVIYGNNLATVQWHADGVATPTQSEVDAELARLQAEETQKAADKAAGLLKLAKASGVSEAEITALIG